jgi:hypothetical protein
MILILIVLGGAGAVGGVILGARWLAYRSWRGSLVRYVLTLPAEVTAEQAVAWVAALAAISHAPRGAVLPPPPLVIEVTATQQGVEHSLTLPSGIAGAVLASLRAALPGVRVRESVLPVSPATSGFVAAASVLLRGRRRQLAIERASAANLGQLAALQPLRRGESIRWQWIVTGTGTPEPIHSPVASQGDLPWWLESQAPADADELRAARLKQRQPLLRVSGRLVVRAPSRARA